ncbi:MAG: hypothetical protein P4L34_09465 [Paludibacter sp.]|nr:hypothetical protein [Paludibacter sp.]
MIKIKQLAIFMDDANALLMELYNHMIVSRNIVFKSQVNEEYIEQHYALSPYDSDIKQYQSAYFDEIADIIKNYKQVVLFGPTDTKEELYKLLETDHHFKDRKIEFIKTDKMTDFQIHDFVLNYYK